MLQHLWRSLRPAPRKPARRRSEKPSALALEQLEVREVPALTWSAGVSLPAARAGDAAVLATDQSILVLGGTTTVNRLALAGTAWGTANAIDQARVSPAVGSIGGGEFLVYGGTAGGAALSTALQYDPSNSSNIHSVAAMSTARSLLAFATDGSNRAYAIGGLDGSGNRLASVERFDPASGTWSPVASLPQALSGAAAVYDGAGDILVFGGATSSSSRSTTALKYTVSTDTWSTLASMPSSTTEAAAVAGPDGLIYVLGGKGSEGTLATVRAYNPTTNTWSQATSLPSGVSDEAAVVDAQNRIEVIGGNHSGDNLYPSSAVYVTQSLANVVPQFTTTALPTATAGAPYVAAVAAIGFPAPTFALVSGPSGLSINATSGVITWAPTTAQIGTQSVTVQASNVAGTATHTFTLTVTPDTTPPTAPVLSMAAPSTTSSLTVSWAPSTDNVGVAGYRLYGYRPAYVSGHSGRGSTITYHPATYTLLVNNLPPTTTAYTFTGLAPNTTYQYVATAFDAAGNQSAYSNAVSGTTLQAPSITYYQGSLVDPPLSVVANHQLSFTLSTGGNPAPTLSLASAPAGVVFNGAITWTSTADQVGVNHIVMQATNSVGTVTLDIPVTVTADVPVPSLSVNGGITYTTGNMTPMAGTPFAYQLTLNPAFNNTGTSPQYALAGTPFSFQVTGTSNTNPTTYALVSGPATMTPDPNSGIGTWAPGASDASAATSVTVSASNSAGTSLLTYTFPTYFTTAPTNVAVAFNTSTSGSAPSTWTPVVTWTAPADATNVADYKVTVTNASTQAATVYDTQSTATSFALPAGITGQNWVNVTAYDANGNPSQTSTRNAPLYLAALGSRSWTFSTPTVVVGQPLSVQFGGGASYAIVSGPAGATIDPTTGLLAWTPTSADVGTATIVVSTGNSNGWGTVYATLSFPVYFTDAPTGLTVTSSTDPVSGVTTWTASWNAPTLNTGNIVGYQIAFVPAGSPPGTAPTLYTVPASDLSVVLSNLATLSGSVQVAAFDAAGDLGAPSLLVSF
jgi:hypothetical protein